MDFTLQTCKPRLPIDPVSKYSVGEKAGHRIRLQQQAAAAGLPPLWGDLGSFQKLFILDVTKMAVADRAITLVVHRRGGGEIRQGFGPACSPFLSAPPRFARRVVCVQMGPPPPTVSHSSWLNWHLTAAPHSLLTPCFRSLLPA